MTEHAAGTRRGRSPLTLLSIVAGFVPWIAFSFVSTRLAADGVAWSALLAVAMTVIALVHGRRRHAPTRLTLYSFVLFGSRWSASSAARTSTAGCSTGDGPWSGSCSD
ncbi:hypothetical protein LWC33_22100 [Pseudonocardia sp. RS11V-5]|uniref:hypothetical protein n=1 Tax=Pseudonocardia terrae TaxID=2905831 RepID=UPI001E5FE79A|nr:hypothetical protein [Pseudonocardia terrae]MCE3554131.1 hypothetical protein [Pseudonocardia terrae]